MKTEYVEGLVSVVVASYNHAEYLDERMKSLLEQTYPHVEIIVIDDCSTDDSRVVLQKYSGIGNVTVVERERNGGWVVVSNQGASIAKGEFLIFANCDDSCKPDLLKQLVDQLGSFPTAALASSMSELIDTNGDHLGVDYDLRSKRFRSYCHRTRLIPARRMQRFLIAACVFPNLSSVLFRRRLFQELGGFSPEFKVVCDWDLFFRMAANHDSVFLLEPLNCFRQHGTSIRSSTKRRALMEEYRRLLYTEANRVPLRLGERLGLTMQLAMFWARSTAAKPSMDWRDFVRQTRQNCNSDPFFLAGFCLALVVVHGVERLGLQRGALIADA